MADRFGAVMAQGQAFLSAADFPAALGEFSEALRYNPQSADAHYAFAFAASEEIGEDFLEEVASHGITLARLHTTWRAVLHRDTYPALCATICELYPHHKFVFKLAVARARQQVASRCIRHLKKALLLQPRHPLARNLITTLLPMADQTPFSTLMTLLK